MSGRLPRASRSSRSARATACRTRPPRSRVEDRVAFCDALVAAGLPVVEVGAFVSPKWVPQMAGSDEVLRRVRKPPGVRLPVLVPNRKGFERARAAGAREIAVFTAASETFSRRNINASIDESLRALRRFVPEARREGLRVRGYVSTAFGCPYEGAVGPGARGRSWRAGSSRPAATRCRSGIPSGSRCRRR